MKLKLNDIKVKDVTKKVRPARVGLMGLAIVATLSFSSCFSDSKVCSDADRSADGNGSTAYDLGANQDANDYGGDTDTGVGDPAGAGDICSDYD